MPTFALPKELRSSIQDVYMDTILAHYSDVTIKEITELLTNNLDEINMRYDEFEACADLEPDDHRYFEREINWAEWCKHVFTGIPITFSTAEQLQAFGNDILQRCNFCLCEVSGSPGCQHCCDGEKPV